MRKKKDRKADPAVQYAPYQSLKGFYDMIDAVGRKRKTHDGEREAEEACETDGEDAK